MCRYKRLLQVCSPSLRLVQQFAGDPDEHAVGKGRLETRFGELVEHLGDSKTVVLPEVIQQAQGMVLEDRIIFLTDQFDLDWNLFYEYFLYAYIKIQWGHPSTHTIGGSQ